mgnify:CR=1 FL=1
MSKKQVEMEENFMYLKNLPLVLKMQKKMKKLKKENEDGEIVKEKEPRDYIKLNKYIYQKILIILY